MWKKYVHIARDFIVKHSKIVFPVIVIAAVAVTVSVALKIGYVDEDKMPPEEPIFIAPEEEEVVEETVSEEVPLVLNEDEAVSSLIISYYNAMAQGDADTLVAISDEITDKDMIRFVETAKYIKGYSFLEIYTKPGPEDGSVIAYVYYKVVFENQEAEYPGYQAHYICSDEQGNLYLKRSENTEDVKDYIIKVSAQDDVVEFNNRITVEYNELMQAQPELLEYLSELDSQVSTAVGEGLAKLAAEQDAENAENSTEGEEQAEAGNDGAVEEVEIYATATTTVNVRTSDSEQADKLGKLSAGGRVRILEQLVNGWSKVLYEGKEGYVKSEFLQLAESAAGVEVIGTVSATTNINVRMTPSETAERLGVLTAGDAVDLVATENGWCKIIYAGQIAYVKADYVR